MNREGSSPHDRTIKERAVEELRYFVVLFFYLWVLFGLFVLNSAVVDRERGFNFVFHGFALLNALVLGKVMLVIENMELSRWTRSKPRVWTILFETCVCTFLFYCFHIVEGIAIGVFHGSTLKESIPSIGGGGLGGSLIVALIMFLSLLPFFAFKNVIRAIGADRMREILFRAPGRVERG